MFLFIARVAAGSYLVPHPLSERISTFCCSGLVAAWLWAHRKAGSLLTAGIKVKAGNPSGRVRKLSLGWSWRKQACVMCGWGQDWDSEGLDLGSRKGSMRNRGREAPNWLEVGK